MGPARGQLTNATKKGDAAAIEAAEKKLQQIEQEIKRAEDDAKDLQGILGEHENVLANADKAEARSAAAEADLKDTQKVAATQQGLSADVDAAEAKVRDIWAKNNQMRPGLGTPEGRELAKAEQDLAQARKELATHIETAQGLTAEIREGCAVAHRSNRLAARNVTKHGWKACLRRRREPVAITLITSPANHCR